jgi:protein-L-isoaspartate(D-aspartate) O-methyltransferase
MTDYVKLRRRMVENDLRARGIRDESVLRAMETVPREAFVPAEHRLRAYDDSPLPIGDGQTISQPYIVAFMVEALAPSSDDKALEVGSGSGYAAAVLAAICREVYAIERVERLAVTGADTLSKLGIRNVHVRFDDGSQGWADEAPFDVIMVSAGAPSVPEALKAQLAIGGRMVIPLGTNPRVQELVRITRKSRHEYVREDIADVRFVPLIGKEGWELDEPELAGAFGQGRARVMRSNAQTADDDVVEVVARSAREFTDLEEVDLDPVLERIGDSRVVLLGEATHGSAEFYRMRQRITRALIERKGFRFVAAEADWPDAARIDHYVRHKDAPATEWTAFARFPTWMWRNADVRDFVDWLHAFNADRAQAQRIGFYGLDLYSMYASMRAVLDYLERVDPSAAEEARVRYACLGPWETDPAAYGHATRSGTYRKCEREVLQVLVALLEKRQESARQSESELFDIVQNATLVANAERYYRLVYYGSRASWNLRDSHMFQTLQGLLELYGPESRGVVWAHNSHTGDSEATEMSARGEFNLGHLVRKAFPGASRTLGFGTDHGEVAAASRWDGAMEVKNVQPSHPHSYEHLFHRASERAFLMSLTGAADPALAAQLAKPRLERAIGVVYRPETERFSHYFEAQLSRQFDEYVWFDRTSAVQPLDATQLEGVPETYPFGV